MFIDRMMKCYVRFFNAGILFRIMQTEVGFGKANTYTGGRWANTSLAIVYC